MGLYSSCALITDGRFSVSNRGLFVGHISPEAYEGGLIALVENGDLIHIDISSARLELLVDDQTLEERRKHFTRKEKEMPAGYLDIYRRISLSASQGAVVR